MVQGSDMSPGETPFCHASQPWSFVRRFFFGLLYVALGIVVLGSINGTKIAIPTLLCLAFHIYNLRSFHFC